MAMTLSAWARYDIPVGGYGSQWIPVETGCKVKENTSNLSSSDFGTMGLPQNLVTRSVGLPVHHCSGEPGIPDSVGKSRFA